MKTQIQSISIVLTPLCDYAKENNPKCIMKNILNLMVNDANIINTDNFPTILIDINYFLNKDNSIEEIKQNFIKTYNGICKSCFDNNIDTK